jgi:hypothetical protein
MNRHIVVLEQITEHNLKKSTHWSKNRDEIFSNCGIMKKKKMWL